MKIPGPGPLQFLYGVRAQGFLAFVGEQWRAHGDVFQVRLFGRTLLFAMHPDAVKHVTVTQRQRYDKRASYDAVRTYLLGEGLVASTGELWRRQRRLMAPFYTTQGVAAYAALMIRDSQRLVERWAQLAAAGEAVEISEEMAAVTASIILRAMFSTETMASIHEMKGAVETMISFVTDSMTSLPLPVWVPTAKNRRYTAARDRVHTFIGALIAEHLLRDESITTFFAGHETTARTMTFAWYALAANPGVAERMHAELDAVLGGGPPTLEALRQLPYTLQVIKEVLRLYPAAPFYVRDAVEADTLAGFDIPVGASVMLSPYYTHRHPDFWEEPEVFNPDRWTREREAAQHSHAWHPFAAGPRVCIGNNFSLLETHLLLATLAQRFTPRLREGYTPRWAMQGTLGLENGLPMVIEAR